MVIANMSMSLDGFVAGPNVSVEHPMGEGGERLHAWMFDGALDSVDEGIKNAMFSPATTGAVVMGRTTFTVGEGPWGDDGTFGMPCFVITHRPAETIVKGPTTFTFVTEGIEQGFDAARCAAGGKNVNVMGASLVRQALNAGLIDEMLLSIVPIVLGGGLRPFEQTSASRGRVGAYVPVQLHQTAVVKSRTLTHLRFRVVSERATEQSERSRMRILRYSSG
ncbi:MAG TPA: dihydrofolate reductase family protein [Vicinamibacterales bacterium]|nr:dihydrofolate reductase family protein [Vicinamibacterales bacterium]